MTRINGIVDSIIFRSEDSGYAVARALLDDGDDVVIVGTMPFLGVGEKITAQGEFTNHPKHGPQFSVTSYSREMPNTVSGIYDYLASGTVRGVGNKTARAIVNAFGTDSFSVIASEPEKLSSIKGVSLSKAIEIGESFRRLNTMKMIMDFLAFYQLPPHISAALFRTYGTSSLELLKKNPYVLCEKGFDLGFYDIDKVAGDLGFTKDCIERLEAGILYELSFNAENGHAFIPEDKLIEATASLCDIDEDELFDPLENLVEKKRVIQDVIKGHDVCYLDYLYRCETFIADEIHRLCSMKIMPPPGLDKHIAATEHNHGIRYGEGQKQAMRMCFESAVSLITGGPGTGKTTTLLCMLELLEADGMSFMLAAPTGRAAKRMSEVCGREAKTLHRLLESVFDSAQGNIGFRRDRSNPLDTDVIIVDEASMLDLLLASSLLDAMKPHTRLVLIGDADQLPPMGPGSFFSELLVCPDIPKTILTEIFRQAQGSDIVVNSHMINQGQVPPIKKNSGDFFFANARSAETTASSVLALITERIPLKFGIEPADIQVICPSRQLACGTAALNVLLQTYLNPPSPQKAEVKAGNAIFRCGDRIMQIKNNYDLMWRRLDTPEVGTGVFNGDTGVIVHIDNAARILVVRYDDKEADYTFDEINQLEHAYAITVHKSQGSEYPAVVLPLFAAPQRLLTRSMLYTAVTRAKKLLVIAGREEIVGQMVETNKKNKRFSALRMRITGTLNDA
ncbi:MAG: ATP-dependent RecD-like DNA helicase [Clostridiaceae bacterium]|nr:ATP-dependent RecD-like DNA helicase [Clostridiaceae bacterium]